MNLALIDQSRLDSALYLLNHSYLGYPLLISQYANVVLDIAPFMVEKFHKTYDFTVDRELVEAKEGRVIHVSGIMLMLNSATEVYLESGTTQISQTFRKDFCRDVDVPSDLYVCAEGEALNLETNGTGGIDIVGWYE